METEVPLLCLQEPATCPHPEPDQSRPCPPSHFLRIHFNILPSMPGSSKWALSLTFPHQTPVYTPSHPYKCYMSRPSHSFRFLHPNNIWWGVQITKLLIMCFSPYPCSLVPLRPKYPPQHTILKHPQCERPSLTPIQNNRQWFCTS